MAIAPIESETALSLMAVQDCPIFVVFQTPPSAAPRYAMLGLVGWTAKQLTRPEAGQPSDSWMFFGPAGFQDIAESSGVCPPLSTEFFPDCRAMRMASDCCRAFTLAPSGIYPKPNVRRPKNHFSNSRG